LSNEQSSAPYKIVVSRPSECRYPVPRVAASAVMQFHYSVAIAEADRREPLVVLRLGLATEIAAIAERTISLDRACPPSVLDPSSFGRQKKGEEL
jgi:hypothetical protein